MQYAEAMAISFTPFPHSADYELDLHRPYIDELPLGSSMDGEWKRVLDVFDCWFESGSMPFAGNHYPFAKESFDPRRFLGLAPKGYPADFIAEGLDQTRGWFYSLIVLGTALFGRSPYKNVIVNGLVLASDGQKMSKRLRNYPDPMEVVEKYGADSLRYFLLSSPVVRAEDLRFKEQGVEEVSKKLLMRLDNVASFYELYAPEKHMASPEFSSQKSSGRPSDSTRLFAPELPALSAHVLDRWILSRLGELVAETTRGFETYELDSATRPLAGFIDDLSTWYLRRSRERFKTEGAGKEQALATLRFVLRTTAHVMAPVMPFFAENLFMRTRGDGDAESVHLSAWPAALSADAALLKNMQRVRAIASMGLEARERAGIKIRQPLARLAAGELPEDPALREIIADEVNVKEVAALNAGEAGEVLLETELTPELKEEGTLRDLVRSIQDLRKKEKLTIADHPALMVATDAQGRKFIERWKSQITAETGLRELLIAEGGEAGVHPFPVTLTIVYPERGGGER